MEWNDPEDVARVSEAFDDWAGAVIAKNQPAVEAFHDVGFRVRTGRNILDKDAHVALELAVDVREMSIIAIETTRRIGDLLLVWSRHLIRADAVPELPELGLTGDWGGREAAGRGFEQLEFTVWRDEGGQLKCLAFEARPAD